MPLVDQSNSRHERYAVLKEETAVEPEDRPATLDVIGAAWRKENVVGSYLAQENGRTFGYDPEFDPYDPEFLKGYEDFEDRFDAVFSREDGEIMKRQIDREREDLDTIRRAGFSGVAASFVAGTLDPTIFIPVGGTIKKGETLLRIGMKSAYGGAAGAALSEVALQSTQETRTAAESGLAIGGATFLAGIAGPSIVGAFRSATGKPVWGFDGDDITSLAGRVEQDMMYDDVIPFEKTEADGVRSATAGLSAQLNELAPDDYRLQSSFGYGELSGTLRFSPILELSNSDSVTVRNFANRLMENGAYLGRNIRGEASPVSVESSLTEYRGWHATAENQVRQLYKDHRKQAQTPYTPKEFYEQVSFALRRGDQHPDPQVQQAAQQYRIAIEKVKERAIEMKLLPKDVKVETADSYFHRMWNRSALVRRTNEFKAMTRTWLTGMFDDMRLRAEALRKNLDATKGELSPEDEAFLQQWDELQAISDAENGLDSYANEVAGQIFDTLMAHDPRSLPANLTMAARGPLKERTFTIPDAFEADGVRVEDFLVNDAQAVMQRYMRVMSTDIEIAREFGSPDMRDVFRKINDEYDKRIAKLNDKDDEKIKNLNDARRREIKTLEGVRDVMRGTYGEPTYESLWRRGAAFVRAWNYTTLLGGMTVSALPDVANKILGHGFLGLTRDLLVPVITNLKGVQLVAKEARDLGIAVEQVLATRIATMADIGDVYGAGTRFERTVGGITNHFSKWTGMLLWNDVMKTSDYLMASRRAIRIMERPERAKTGDKAWLANLGIGEAEYDLLRSQIRKYGESERGMRLANPEQWGDPEARRIWIAAMGKNANIQTVTKGAGDIFLAAQGDLGKTLTQFKSFAFASNQRVLMRALQQARAGDGKVLAFLMSAISLGMLVYYLKSAGSGRQTSDDPVTWVREGIDRSGIASIFMEGFNATEKLTGQTFVGESPASRYASRGVVASFLGPSFGKGEDVATLIRNLSDGSLKDRDIHAVRKLLPYNNLFYARSILDDLEIAATEAVGAEETSLSERREPVLIGR